MFFANDIKGIKTHIEDAKNDKQYFCPICAQEVIQRKGTINLFHFAHKANSNELCDSWSHDMSNWHKGWQDLFPKDNREIVIEHMGVKHRADVRIGHTVIEFQHSRISKEEFKERNNFYTGAGFEIVWLFDLIEEFETKRIIQNADKEGVYKWNYHWHTFDDFTPRDSKNIKVFFQIHEELSEDFASIEYLVWQSPDGKYFATNEEVYDKNEFVDLFIEKNVSIDANIIYSESQFTIADIQDTLIEENGYYSPCFIQSNGRACWEDCDCCKYSIKCLNEEAIGKGYYSLYENIPDKVFAEYVSGCLYRFRDILEGWDIYNDKVVNVEYDNEGRILEVIIIKSGTQIIKKYERVPCLGRTLLEILRNSDANVIGARNLRTGYRVKVGNSDYFENENIYQIKGYLGISNSHSYYRDRRYIYDWNKPEWILEWEK